MLAGGSAGRNRGTPVHAVSGVHVGLYRGVAPGIQNLPGMNFRNLGGHGVACLLGEI